MPGQCCSATTTQTQSRTSMLAKYVRQSLLCGILGSLKFVIALASVIQTSIFLQSCRGLNSHSRDSLRANLWASKRNLKLGILPSVEMFIMMPAIFVGLHLGLNVALIYCLATCWAAMFMVCFTVRVLGVLTSCPAVESPMYRKGFPFPITKNSNNDPYVHHARDDTKHVKCMQNLDSPLSVARAYALALLFVPLRAVTAVAQAILLAVELVTFPVVLASDICIAIFRSVSNKVAKSSSSQRGAQNFQSSKESLTFAWSLTKALMTDLLWVVSLGTSGVSKLRDSTKVRWYYPPIGGTQHHPGGENTQDSATIKNTISSQSNGHIGGTGPSQQHIVHETAAQPEQQNTVDAAPYLLQNTTSVPHCCQKKILAS